MSSIMSARTRAALTAACLHLIFTASAFAQDRWSEVTAERREECQAAATVAREGSQQELILALGELSLCDRTGPEALAAIWRSRPQNETVILQLSGRSREIRDIRLLDAVLATARDERAPTGFRMAALSVLATYVDSTAQLKEYPPSGTDPRRFLLLSSAHHLHRDGARPFPPGHVRRILGEMERIVDSTADDRIAGAARFLRGELELRIRRSR